MRDETENPKDANQTQGSYLGAEIAQTSLIDRLRAKRANVAREYSKRIKELDRQIDLLDRSDAESIVKQAEKVLYQD